MLLVIVRDSKARYSFQSSFSSLNICHQRILIIVITHAFTFGEILSSLIIPTPLVLIILWTFYDCSGLLIKISQNQFTRKFGKTLRPSYYTLTDDQELINMYRAADHRRAELVSGGRLFDLGQVPKSVWHYVQ
ncbi:H-NS-and StpA-binding protein [Escherichia coli]|uniref:H-NS-and StpA-binding protein n=1 Tax=Escherichia coli TaxID=562 RepID=A0A376S7L0_ECOLX|nr:H-NS-and StpA-binding protein [Escherichia coli]